MENNKKNNKRCVIDLDKLEEEMQRNNDSHRDVDKDNDGDDGDIPTIDLDKLSEEMNRYDR